MLSQTAKEAVARGAALLDEKVPGWWKVIDLEKLRMQNCTNCMLGQLFGHETELALGAKMFGLPLIEKLQGLNDESEFSKLDSNYDQGYYRGIKALLGAYNSVFDGTHIGCMVKGNDVFSDLKCEWADIIASRRAQEAQNEQ